MSAWFAGVPWQEIAVMILVGAAVFGLAICFGKRSCGGCGHCTCDADGKERDRETTATDAKKRS
jgi:hypothetical protein